MAITLTHEQKEKIKKKFDSGEWTARTPEFVLITKNIHHGAPDTFGNAFLSYHLEDDSPPFHKELYELFLKHKRIAVAAPRGHAKSTATSFIFVLHEALYERKKNIIIISASETMAKKFLRRIRTELEVNVKLKNIFEDQKTDKWSETELILKNGTVITALGRGAQLRGLISGASRPDLIILDDVEDEELVRSQQRRADLESWFNGSVVPSLDPKTGQVILIGTVLHMDSLLNRVLDKQFYPEYETRRYAALMKDGEPLWPARFSQDFLTSIKESHIARNQLARFYMEYMNDPVPEEDAKFKPEYISYYDPVTLDRSKLIIETFVDLGGGSVRADADPTAMVTLGIDESNVIYVLDYINDRMGTDTKRIINAFFEINRQHKPRQFTVEKTLATNMIKSALEAECRNRGEFLNIQYVTPTRGSSDRRGNMSDGKYQRIAAMEGAFKMHMIKILPSQTELKEQLFMFPRGVHDDILDAAAYGFSYLTRRLRPKLPPKPVTAIFPFEDGYEEPLGYEYQELYPQIGL